MIAFAASHQYTHTHTHMHATALERTRSSGISNAESRRLTHEGMPPNKHCDSHLKLSSPLLADNTAVVLHPYSLAHLSLTGCRPNSRGEMGSSSVSRDLNTCNDPELEALEGNWMGATGRHPSSHRDPDSSSSSHSHASCGHAGAAGTAGSRRNFLLPAGGAPQSRHSDAAKKAPDPPRRGPKTWGTTDPHRQLSFEELCKLRSECYSRGGTASSILDRHHSHPGRPKDGSHGPTAASNRRRSTAGSYSSVHRLLTKEEMDQLIALPTVRNTTSHSQGSLVVTAPSAAPGSPFSAQPPHRDSGERSNAENEQRLSRQPRDGEDAVTPKATAGDPVAVDGGALDSFINRNNLNRTNPGIRKNHGAHRHTSLGIPSAVVDVMELQQQQNSATQIAPQEPVAPYPTIAVRTVSRMPDQPPLYDSVLFKPAVEARHAPRLQTAAPPRQYPSSRDTVISSRPGIPTATMSADYDTGMMGDLSQTGFPQPLAAPSSHLSVPRRGGGGNSLNSPSSSVSPNRNASHSFKAEPWQQQYHEYMAYCQLYFYQQKHQQLLYHQQHLMALQHNAGSAAGGGYPSVLPQSSLGGANYTSRPQQPAIHATGERVNRGASIHSANGYTPTKSASLSSTSYDTGGGTAQQQQNRGSDHDKQHRRGSNKESRRCHDNTPQELKYLQADPFSMYKHNKQLNTATVPNVTEVVGCPHEH